MFFRNPLFFIFLPIVLACVFYARKKDVFASLKFSYGALLAPARSSFRLKLFKFFENIRACSLILIIFALSRPQAPVSDSKIRAEGIDIALAIDCSTSMLMEDFQIKGRRMNRLDAVKEVVKEFIQGRKNDRIALVAFASRAYTVCPLTLDYNWLEKNLERVKIGIIEDGTAIGSGLATALNRLKDDTRTKSKIVILLTDGNNNAGNITPQAAGEAAKALNIKTYTIGAGTKGFAPYPVKDFFGNTVYQQVKIDLDEETLKKIADTTGARYFRAADTESLARIYKEIDRMEKTPFEDKGFNEFRELFGLFLIPAVCLLSIEVILGNTIFRKIP